MQLSKKSELKASLFAASCALLGTQAQADEWDFDAAVMYYGETDRVQAVEGIFTAKKNLSDDRTWLSKLVFDTLTGASANGAVAQNQPQTFTSPSGRGQYQIAANETPLDDTFKDTRVQLATQWSQPLWENYTGSAGINISNEYDYQSVSLNGVIGRYLNDKNTTLSVGLSYALDNVSPVGGRPIGLSQMVIDSGQPTFQDEFDATRLSGDDTKNTLDLVLGWTQVINRRWITQFNLSLSQVDGYLTDPYKLVSRVDATGTVLANLYENRPDSRSKQSFYAESKYHFDNSILDLSYRLANDDWGVQSHTLEGRYRYLFEGGSYLEPHLRIYQQQEADFYQPFLTESETLPEFASADYRIGKLSAYTLGLKYGKKLSHGREFSVRAELYSQAPQDVGKALPGQLQQQDLYPSLDAVILQVNYKF